MRSEAIVCAASILGPLVVTVFCSKTRAFGEKGVFSEFENNHMFFARGFSARGVRPNIVLVGPALQNRFREHVH